MKTLPVWLDSERFISDETQDGILRNMVKSLLFIYNAIHVFH
jgi:hypothetical protein